MTFQDFMASFLRMFTNLFKAGANMTEALENYSEIPLRHSVEVNESFEDNANLRAEERKAKLAQRKKELEKLLKD